MDAATVLHFKALMGAWFHQTRRKIPKGYSPHAPTVGVVFRRMIVTYQKAHGLKVDGTLNTQTQKTLDPPDPITVKRAHAVAYCQWGIEHHGSFVYRQDRPAHSPGPGDLWTLPRAGRYRDCSYFAKDSAQAGGFEDPTGFGFNEGYGNSDSMVTHCKHVPIAALKQGDFIAFESPGHIVVVTGPHATDPAGALWVASDGHQGAPEMTTLAREESSHSGYVIGLSVVA